MANIKSAIKRIRSSARKQQNNRILRGRARSAVKKARLALGEGKPEDAQTAVKKAISELDRHQFGGRSLTVNEAKPMAARSGGGR